MGSTFIVHLPTVFPVADEQAVATVSEAAPAAIRRRILVGT
jgi:hypothetical protein